MFETLDAIIKTDGTFLKDNINRSTLAKTTNTNEEYVRKTIKDNTEMGDSEYITALWLQHALTLLSDDNNNDTINVILEEYGFNTVSTFYSLFQQRFGISPGEFRKNARNKTQAI